MSRREAVGSNDGLGPNAENVMNVEFTKEWCMDMAKHEGAAGDPDCSAGAAVAPLRAVAQVVALEPEGPDGHGVNWLAGKRPKPGELLFSGDAVARALAAKNEAESRELKSLQELDEQREQLACVRQALPEEWRNSVPSVAVSTLAAEIATLREQLARFTPLRAKGVVDADDNLDCWDTNPYEICTRHVAALNEKDPAAMWRVVDLFARDEAGPGA